MPEPLRVGARFRPRSFALLVVVSSSLVVAACGLRPAPVGELTVTPAHVPLAYPERSDVRLSWSPTAELSGLAGELRVFVHLREIDGAVLRTFDHPLPESWRPGRMQEYDVPLYQSGLGPPLSPGRYQLTVGLYDEAGHRWPIATSGEEVDRFEYAVTEVAVPAATGPVPMFTMSTAWQPLEAGDGNQILGRRWLTGAGSIALTEIRQPGTVWMQFRIPQVREGQESVVPLTPGQSLSVRITTDCGSAEEYVSGAGVHQVEVPLVPPAEFDSVTGCTIDLEPSFEIVQLDSLTRRSLQLEILSWMPGDRTSS